jgi:hypothetical protein
MSAGGDWPIAGEYSNMLQNPQVAFRDTALKTCTVERDPKTRQPVARSGAFATVYKGTHTDGRDVAIRVFTRASGTTQRDRYAAISEYVNGLNGDRPASLVGFNFEEKGIRVASKGGKWFPLLTMDWVPGDTLFDWVRSECRTGKGQQLGDVADKWVELVRDLSNVRIAHGDLQHGNVMVTPSGQLQLVDYDCMCVPNLVGQPNLEIGVEPYQHRERDDNTLLYSGMDNFSALFILVALRAFAINPQLWFQFNEPVGGTLYDKLLFRREDFDSPHNSKIYAELRRQPDEKLRRWAGNLFELWQVPMKEVPPLIEIASDVDKVMALLSENSFDEALRLLSPKNAPPELRPALQDAEARVNCRKQLDQAVMNGDEAGMVSLYDPHLLDDYPQAADVASEARKAAQVIPVLKQLQQARQAAQWRQLVRIWDSHQNLLAGRVSTESFERDVRQWRDRNNACDLVLQLLNDPACKVTGLRDAWVQLKQLGGHPEADQHEATVQSLIARHDALDNLLKVAHAASRLNDQALVQAWNEKLFAGWADAGNHRPRVKSAKLRLKELKSVHAIIDQNDRPITRAGEQAIAQAAMQVDDNYDPSIQARLELARQRLAAVQKLEAVCSLSPITETEVASAWLTVQTLQAEAMLVESVRQRALQASDLAPLLQTLNTISRQGPPNPQRDHDILAVWNDALRNCPEAADWLAIYEEAAQRRKLLRQLDRAIADSNEGIIVECCESPLLSGWPFSAAQSDGITRARQAIERVSGLVRVLETGQRDQFAQVFDYRIFQEFPSQFIPFLPQLKEWLPMEVLPREKIGLAMPTLGRSAAIQKSLGNSGWSIQWRWPEMQYSEVCLIKLTRSVPAATSHPDSLQRVEHTQSVTRKSYDGGGGRVSVRPLKVTADWMNCCVSVWACIEICGETFYSEPLILGRLT